MLDTLRQVQDVAHVALRHERTGMVETTQALQGVVIRGLDSTSQVTRIASGLLHGRLPAEGSAKEVLIGAPLAQNLNWTPHPV